MVKVEINRHTAPQRNLSNAASVPTEPFLSIQFSEAYRFSVSVGAYATVGMGVPALGKSQRETCLNLR